VPEKRRPEVQLAWVNVTYRSVIEMQAALTTINKEIEQAGGGNASPRQIVINPKGI